MPFVVVFEDDCEFPDGFEAKLRGVFDFLATLDEWHIFNGCIANLPPDTDIQILQRCGETQFVQVDKMHSTVFNIYHHSVYDKILGWDLNTTSRNNQIDQYIKHLPDMKIITTHPFLVQCVDVDSTLWGKNLHSEYNRLFRKSHDLIEKAIDTHTNRLAADDVTDM